MLDTYLQSVKKITYHYTNQTQQIQIVRVDNGLNAYIERAVFPDKCVDFDALPDALLEIHTHAIATAVLSDRIPCQKLTPFPLSTL